MATPLCGWLACNKDATDPFNETISQTMAVLCAMLFPIRTKPEQIPCCSNLREASGEIVHLLLGNWRQLTH